MRWDFNGIYYHLVLLDHEVPGRKLWQRNVSSSNKMMMMMATTMIININNSTTPTLFSTSIEL